MTVLSRTPRLRAKVAALALLGDLASGSNSVAQSPATTTGASPRPAAGAPIDRPRFALDRTPPAPDYADPSAWAVRPGAPSLADLVPAGAEPRSTPDRAAVDVFYIQPTTYHGGHWNQDIADAETNAWTDVSVIARQLSIFNACCRLYAPRYRQAGTGAVTSTNGDGGLAYDLAYQDARRAFRYYLAHDNGGRPFVLAGHSQGALLIYRLIEDEIDGTPLAGRMVVAYAPGVGLSMGAFGRTYKTISACLRPEQTGCIASWNTLVRGTDASSYVQRAEARFVTRYSGTPGRELLCVNPLTFDASSPSAPASRALGALPGDAATDPDASRALPALVPHALGATCEGGVLQADLPASTPFKLKVLPGGVLHMHDFDFFYEDVRRNVGLRVAAYLAAHPQTGVKPKGG